jgi:hypothetical protein
MYALLLSLFLALPASARPPSPPDVDPDVTLQLSIVGARTEFHIGETVPLLLAFSAAIKNRYQINMAQYDRSGRMNYEQFNLSPSGGAVDPLAGHLSGFGGGLTSFDFLTPNPWTITLDLNEWLRFTQPGDYRLTITSNRVSVKDPSSPMGASSVTVQSNEISFKIIPATKDWQTEVLTNAVVALNEPPSKPEDREKDAKARRQALETLRFLGTPDATAELARRFRGEDNGGLDYVCMLGLISSPDPDVARRALEHELEEPDHPISDNFFYALQTLAAGGTAPNQDWKKDERQVLEALVSALPAKRGKALTVSLTTAVNKAWNGAEIPEQTTNALVAQMVSLFDQLPSDGQALLLTNRWDKVAGPNMVPILRHYAEAYQDFPQMREMKAYSSLELSASALQHWYELDPVGARPAIIREITRPRPRFGARVLGILPDETLPEVDFALAEHLTAGSDFDGIANITSLIARYATDAILPQVTAKLDPSLGKWACAIQDPLLAYLLRVNPPLARPRIEQAVAARGKDFSACNHGLFPSIAEIHYDPVLEEIAIHSLDDSDPQVAMNAASMLGRYGSPAAESGLRQRFAAWSVAWTGREAELDLTFAATSGDRADQLGLGENLVRALATAKSWLADEDSLRRLSELTRVKRVRDELDSYLKTWENHPPIISFHNNPAPAGLDARVAQYEFHSVDDLESKLRQFPAGTKFVLQTPVLDPSPDQHTLAELRTFLKNNGMIVAAEKRQN